MNVMPAQPPHLTLPNYVHRLIALNRSSRRLEFTKPLLGVHSPFDRAMVLLDDVVQILDGTVAAPAAEMYTGENPARYVRLPEMRRKQKHSLTHDQMNVLLEALPAPAAEMAHVAVLTSLNVAEICALQWKDINLSNDWVVVDGEPIDPMTILVVRQWSTRKGGGAYHTLKAGSRRRKEPIDAELAAVLRAVASRSKFTWLEDPVFSSSLRIRRARQRSCAGWRRSAANQLACFPHAAIFGYLWNPLKMGSASRLRSSGAYDPRGFAESCNCNYELVRPGAEGS